MKQELNTLIFDFVCENLPDDWEIKFNCRVDEMGVELVNPDGDTVDEFVDDDGNLFDFVRERVDYARRSDGLGQSSLPEGCSRVHREE